MEGECEACDRTLIAGNDVTFHHSLCRKNGTDADRRTFDSWIRRAQYFREVHGKWSIADERISVPIEKKTDRGLIELRPQGESRHDVGFRT